MPFAVSRHMYIQGKPVYSGNSNTSSHCNMHIHVGGTSCTSKDTLAQGCVRISCSAASSATTIVNGFHHTVMGGHQQSAAMVLTGGQNVSTMVTCLACHSSTCLPLSQWCSQHTLQLQHTRIDSYWNPEGHAGHCPFMWVEMISPACCKDKPMSVTLSFLGSRGPSTIVLAPHQRCRSWGRTSTPLPPSCTLLRSVCCRLYVCSIQSQALNGRLRPPRAIIW